MSIIIKAIQYFFSVTIVLINLAFLDNASGQSAIYFTDNFESGLTNWTGKNSGTNFGIIVADTLAHHVLSFSGVSYNGDIFIKRPFDVSKASSVWITFDYLGKTTNGSTPGGFVGISTTLAGISVAGTGAWVAGSIISAVSTTTNFTPVQLVNDGTWHTYTVNITPFLKNNSWTNIFVMSEDWGGAGSANNVFFDNFSVAVNAATPTISTTVYSNRPVIYFPTSAGTNFVLQMTTNLNSGTWTNITGIPISGIIVTNTNSSAFFRLQ